MLTKKIEKLLLFWKKFRISRFFSGQTKKNQQNFQTRSIFHTNISKVSSCLLSLINFDWKYKKNSDKNYYHYSLRFFKHCFFPNKTKTKIIIIIWFWLSFRLMMMIIIIISLFVRLLLFNFEFEACFFNEITKIKQKISLHFLNCEFGW